MISKEYLLFLLLFFVLQTSSDLLRFVRLLNLTQFPAVCTTFQHVHDQELRSGRDLILVNFLLQQAHLLVELPQVKRGFLVLLADRFQQRAKIFPRNIIIVCEKNVQHLVGSKEEIVVI